PRGAEAREPTSEARLSDLVFAEERVDRVHLLVAGAIARGDAGAVAAGRVLGTEVLDAAADVAEARIGLQDLLVVVERLALVAEAFVGGAQLEVERERLALGDAVDVEAALELVDRLLELAALDVAKADHEVVLHLAARRLADQLELLDRLLEKAH